MSANKEREMWSQYISVTWVQQGKESAWGLDL